MICKYCGTEIKEGTKFCPNCGSRIEEENKNPFEENPFETKTEVVEPKKQAKCWAIFAKVSKILGIVAISTCWIPFMIGLGVGSAGIVFAILGKQAYPEESKEQCKLGLTLSIVGTAVSFVTYIIFIAAIASCGSAAASNYYYY